VVCHRAFIQEVRKTSNDGAADALKLRYIKGELTEEEYLS
jgi:uncharacterized membrane protein